MQAAYFTPAPSAFQATMLPTIIAFQPPRPTGVSTAIERWEPRVQRGKTENKEGP